METLPPASPLTLEDALHLLETSASDTVPIADEQGRILALLTKPSLLPPPELSGMATPLGVYLTDGYVSGGAGPLGLLLTGCVLSSLSLLAHATALHTGHLFPNMAFTLSAYIPSLPLRNWMTQSLQSQLPMLLTLALLFGILRLLPLSGIHAAEHQTVHCVERRLPLTITNIRSMPRAHPRCGTNLVTGLLLFQAVFQSVFTLAQAENFGTANASTLGLLCAGPAAYLLWQRVGTVVQWLFATKPATDAQIRGAIRAAETVLSRQRHGKPSGIARLRSSGIGWVFAGYGVVFAVLSGLSHFWPALGLFLGV